MDKIQRTLIKAGHKNLAQEYYNKIAGKYTNVVEEWEKRLEEVSKKEWKKFFREFVKNLKGKEIMMPSFQGMNPSKLIPKKIYQRSEGPKSDIMFVDKITNKEWVLEWDRTHNPPSIEIL